MFDYWKKVDSLSHVNRLLLGMVATLTLIVLALIITLALTPHRYQFWLTPSLAENGGLVRPNQIPNAYVHGFAATLMPALTSWSANGIDEFKKNVNAYHYYLTPRHLQLLQATLATNQTADLFHRSQTASLYRYFEAGDVQRLNDNTWEVQLWLRLTERLTPHHPLVIADKVVAYHLRVVKVNLSSIQNPYQLALDGYTKPERLMMDLLAEPTKETS